MYIARTLRGEGPYITNRNSQNQRNYLPGGAYFCRSCPQPYVDRREARGYDQKSNDTLDTDGPTTGSLFLCCLLASYVFEFLKIKGTITRELSRNRKSTTNRDTEFISNILRSLPNESMIQSCQKRYNVHSVRIRQLTQD